MGTEGLTTPVDFVPVDDEWPSTSVGHLLRGTPSASRRNSIVAFRQEPTGAAYHEILDITSRICYAFCLVWREQLEFNVPAFQLVEQLQPWLCFERRTDHWPATRLGDSLALIRWYRISPQSLTFLHQASGLYQWRSPNLPEDLAFYLQNGEAWLGSISHENTAWFDRSRIDPALAKSLMKRFRRLGLIDA